jgi:uncharacterized SAM-dependent methyltransferase
MYNHLLKIQPYSDFLIDTYDWFLQKRFGHMDKWGYLSPKHPNDLVRGAELWDIWEQEASKGDNMLKRQGNIIADKISNMASLTGPCNTLIDLGPGGLNAVKKNTVPFIQAYSNSLEKYVAIDIGEDAAINATNKVTSIINNINVHAINSDFLDRETHIPYKGKTIALMMGGTIGNFEAKPNTPDAINLMAKRIINLKHVLPQNTIIFIGLEATQNKNLLYKSYDHLAHIKFEINLMHGIKRDLLSKEDGFDPYAWKYTMRWHPDAHQFCHIAEATELQRFEFLGEDIRFPKGTQLVIDNSFKFPILAMQRAAGLAKTKYLKPFSDKDGRMVIHSIQL